MGCIPPFILSLSFHRPQRRSPLNHPEAGKEKLTPIQRVVKVWLMLVRWSKQRHLWSSRIKSLNLYSIQGRPLHVGRRSATTLMWVFLASPHSDKGSLLELFFPLQSSRVEMVPVQSEASHPLAVLHRTLTPLRAPSWVWPTVEGTDCLMLYIQGGEYEMLDFFLRFDRTARRPPVCVSGNTTQKPPRASVFR